jgi:glycosyltransferase involved in cell wall biosynthesis
VRRAIEALGVDGIVRLRDPVDLRGTLRQSRLFVSTQETENFTSLAMLEAMACGNAILARDVGQTRKFVRPRANGILVASDDPDAVADGLLTYLNHPDLHAAWQMESRRITVEEHCRQNVLAEFEAFWLAALAPHSSAPVVTST